MNTVKTGVPSPVPNHSIASTSQAIGGVPSSTVTQGLDIIDAVIDTPAATPSKLPASTASARPTKVRHPLIASAGQSSPPRPAQAINCWPVSSGVDSTSGP